MTLEEAIQHCNDKAAELNGTACGIEHKQLRDWLEELKKFREVSKESAIIIDGVKHTFIEDEYYIPGDNCVKMCSLYNNCVHHTFKLCGYVYGFCNHGHFEILKQE